MLVTGKIDTIGTFSEGAPNQGAAHRGALNDIAEKAHKRVVGDNVTITVDERPDAYVIRGMDSTEDEDPGTVVLHGVLTDDWNGVDSFVLVNPCDNEDGDNPDVSTTFKVWLQHPVVTANGGFPNINALELTEGAIIAFLEEGTLDDDDNQVGVALPLPTVGPFMAVITDHTDMVAGARWKYDWHEVVIDGTDDLTTPSPSRSGTSDNGNYALNLVEFQNTVAADVGGDGVDPSGPDYPAGFARRPIGGSGTSDTHAVDVVVMMFPVRNADGQVRFVFSQVNPHDGTCDAP